MSDPFAERLRRNADAFDTGIPDIARMIRRGRQRKALRMATAGGVGVVCMLAVAFPLLLLSGLGAGPSPVPHQGLGVPPVAFTDANGRIALMQPDGSGIRQITTGREHDAYAARYGSSQDLDPHWGAAASAAELPDPPPPAQLVYFVRRYGETAYSLCSVSPSGTGFRVVIRNFPAGQFAVSPSGFRIAYGAGSGIYMVGIDGSSPIRIAQFPLLPAGVPITWSPQEHLIAFVAGNQRLWTVDSRTGELQTVTRPGTHVEAATWDPNDASAIAVTILSDFKRASASAQVWTIRPDGTGLRRLTMGSGNWTVDAWSSDSSQLLLGRLDVHLRDEGLAVIAADGTGLAVINADALSGFASWRA